MRGNSPVEGFMTKNTITRDVAIQKIFFRTEAIQPKTDFRFGFSDQKLVGIRQNPNRGHFRPKICIPVLLGGESSDYFTMVSGLFRNLKTVDENITFYNGVEDIGDI